MKHHQGGFTLIELMIVVAIIGILAAVFVPMVSGKSPANRWVNAKPTPPGTHCLAGYLHVTPTNRQLIDTNGHGVRCE